MYCSHWLQVSVQTEQGIPDCQRRRDSFEQSRHVRFGTPSNDSEPEKTRASSVGRRNSSEALFNLCIVFACKVYLENKSVTENVASEELCR